MKVDSTLLELPTITRNASVVKKVILQGLVDEKVITEEQAEFYNDKWQVVLAKTSWFQKWKSKLFQDEEKGIYQYSFVKTDD